MLAHSSTDAPCTIVVVDDDEVIRDFLTHVLELEGFDVVSLADGEAALKHLRANRADLLLVDCFMPHMDARDLHAALTAVGDPLAERMIFMSGNLRDARMGRFLEEVQAPTLEKPFRVAQVRELIGQILGLAG